MDAGRAIARADLDFRTRRLRAAQERSYAEANANGNLHGGLPSRTCAIGSTPLDHRWLSTILTEADRIGNLSRERQVRLVDPCRTSMCTERAGQTTSEPEQKRII